MPTAPPPDISSNPPSSSGRPTLSPTYSWGFERKTVPSLLRVLDLLPGASVTAHVKIGASTQGLWPHGVSPQELAGVVLTWTEHRGPRLWAFLGQPSSLEQRNYGPAVNRGQALSVASGSLAQSRHGHGLCKTQPAGAEHWVAGGGWYRGWGAPNSTRPSSGGLLGPWEVASVCQKQLALHETMGPLLTGWGLD